MRPAWSRKNLERLSRVGELGRALGLVKQPEPAAPPKKQRIFVLARTETDFERWQLMFPEVEAIRLTDEKQLDGLSDPAYSTFSGWWEDNDLVHLWDSVSKRGHIWSLR